MSRSAFEVRAEPAHLPLQIAPLTFGADLDEILLALFSAPDEDLLYAVDDCMVQLSIDLAARNKTEEGSHVDAEESERKRQSKIRSQKEVGAPARALAHTHQPYRERPVRSMRTQKIQSKLLTRTAFH